MNRLLLVLFFTVEVFSLAREARFDNYKVYRLLPETFEQLRQIQHIEDSGLPFDFWKGPQNVNVPIDVMVPPHLEAQFHEIIAYLQINAEIKIDNVQRLVDENKPTPATYRKKFGWKNYHSLDQINNWLEETAAAHHPHAEVITVGRSYQGRDIKGVKVSFKEGNKAVFIEGGIHAREWISPATVTFILNELLTSKDPSVRDIAESYDWYIVPSVNPDGYAYTHSLFRLCRKTRSSHNDQCVGVDANRNWNFHWNENETNGPCSEFYPGTSPFSEPEMKSFSEYITSVAKDLVVYVAIHSFGQKILIPYSHGEYAENYAELMEIGQKIVASIGNRYGTEYEVGNWADSLYVSSGVSMDWVKGVHKVPIVYTFELRDRGRHMFLLPSDQIIPTAEEVMDSIITMIQEVKARGY